MIIIINNKLAKFTIFVPSPKFTAQTLHVALLNHHTTQTDNQSRLQKKEAGFTTSFFAHRVVVKRWVKY
jgi:hypothetical protein